jgi:GMP synthase (glutamine-hydrolysing)
VRIIFAEHPEGGGPGVFGDVAPMERWRTWEEPPPDGQIDLVVAYGGATNVVDAERLPWVGREIEWLSERVADGTPVLGLCLGGQLLAAALGAEVARSHPPEIGWHPVWLTDAGREDPVMSVFDDTFVACQWHSWTFAIPQGAQALALSAACPQAFRHGRCVGVQFHPEVDRPTLSRWIASYRNDPDAVARGFDPEHARREMDERLSGWNDQGRRLFAAFLADAA